MKIKKILIPFLCLLVIFAVGPTYAFAEETPVSVTETDTDTTSDTDTDGTSETETDENLEEEAGVTPDSWLYSIEQMIESIQVAVTFSADGKAELLIEFANERLAEAQIMSDQDQQDLVEKVILTYSETIKKANFQVQKIIEDTDVSEDSEDILDETTGETEEETATEDTEVTEEQARISSLIEKIELVQSDADKIAIKLTGNLSEEQAELMANVIKAEVQNTIALRAYVTAKKTYVNSVKQFATAKKELGQALSTGDETVIQAAREKVELAEQNKIQMKELSKDVHELQKEVAKENRVVMKEQKEEIKELKKANRNDDADDADDADDEAVEEDGENDNEDNEVMVNNTEKQNNTKDSKSDRENNGKHKD